MIARLEKHIKKYDLLQKGERLLLTVSGGKDSVCMAHLLAKLDFPLAIAHCNFGLRGEESDGDQYFVKSLAEQLQIPFFFKRFETEKYARWKGISTQMAARDLRYAWFSELGFDKIATAHHQDDSIETLLIKKSRKASLEALRGIAIRNGKVIRPLLCFSSKEIEQYLVENKLKWREDSSNASLSYQRNEIRWKTLPQMEQSNPNVRQELLQEIADNEKQYQELLTEKQRLQKNVLQESNNSIEFHYSKLMQHPQKEELLYEFLKSFGPFNWPDVFQLLEAESGKLVANSNYRLLKNRTSILITTISVDASLEYSVLTDFQEIKVPFHLGFSVLKAKGFQLEKDSKKAALDFDQLHFPLTLRKWEKGDSFVPLGMKGRKNVSDFMIDQKFSSLQKESTWVLCSKEDIVWVVGHRIDERYRLVAQTEKVYLVEPLQKLK